MEQPLLILDPGHGGSASVLYDMDNGLRAVLAPEGREAIFESEKRYLSETAYRRWREGVEEREPRYYFLHRGRRLTHGDPGALCAGCPGLAEKDLTLDLVRTLRALLVPGPRVKVTRSRDGYVGVAARAQLANRTGTRLGGPGLFLSLHTDAAADPEVKGVVVYRRRGRDLEVAEVFRQALAAHLSELGVRSGRRELRCDPQPVLQRVEMPALCLQLGFLSNPEDAARLVDRHRRQQLARSLAGAVERWFGAAGAVAKWEPARLTAGGGTVG
jgi:N-acetylmuramoyl-L-alanine amidase